MIEPGDDTTGKSVQMDGVTICFDDVEALSDIDLTIPHGEFFTLVGPSGCGKTTTLRTLAGFEEPTRGAVRLGETEMVGVPPEQRNIGIVFQNYALFPHMTVRENVAYGLRYRSPPGNTDKVQRVTEMLELVNLPGLGDREPQALSGGQQQRVALARALAPGPDVLLLDEPLSALDARLREQLRVTICDIQQQLQITTVYVTHDQAEALAISDRVGVMHEGQLEQVGPPETIYHEPSTRFVAEFIGDNNVFEATVSGTDPVRLKVGEASLPAPVTQPSGKHVTACVRPENITLGTGEMTLTATVEHVEFLGDAYRIHCNWQDRTVIAKTATEPSDETVTLGINASDVYLL